MEERETEVNLDVGERKVVCHRTQFMLKTDSIQGWGAALLGWGPDNLSLQLVFPQGTEFCQTELFLSSVPLLKGNSCFT